MEKLYKKYDIIFNKFIKNNAKYEEVKNFLEKHNFYLYSYGFHDFKIIYHKKISKNSVGYIIELALLFTSKKVKNYYYIPYQLVDYDIY